MEASVFSTLPPAVKQVIIDDRVVQFNKKIRSDFTLNEDQFDFVLGLLADIILKRVSVLDVTDHMARIPMADKVDLRVLTLRLAVDRLWPLQEYLGNVDVLINRLGGQVPTPVSMPRVSTTQAQPDVMQSTAKELLRKFKLYSEMYLTQKPLRDADGRLKPPTVDNWLKDYFHVAGAASNSSLKRSQYLVKSQNVKGLNEAEKNNLLNFLISYEDDQPMYWRIEEEQYLVAETEKNNVASGRAGNHQSLAVLLRRSNEARQRYQQAFADKRRGLEVEINGSLRKLYDIIWDALAMADAPRVLAAFDLLIERGGLQEMLKIDQRYRGIVARSVDMRYGTEAKTFWNGDMNTSVAQALLWQLVLVEKMHLPEDEAANLADYFADRLGLSEKIAYLDLATEKFAFRKVQYQHRALMFV